MLDQLVLFGLRLQNLTVVLDGEQASGMQQLQVGYHTMHQFMQAQMLHFTI